MVEPNRELRAARERTPSKDVPTECMSAREVAEAVNAWLWVTTGRRYEISGNYISRMERGNVRWPNPAYRSALRHVLGVATDVELGLRNTRRSANTLITQGAERPTVETEGYEPVAAQLVTESAPIDTDYLEGIRKEIRNFVYLDQQYGGVAASPLILQAYRQIRHRVNTSGIRKGLHRDTYSSLSEVAEVAGWSLYDSAKDTLTESVNHESLSLARMAGDRNMELFVLQNMAMHAETMNRPHESIRIARLVLETGRLSPRLETVFRERLARSYARLGVEGESQEQLRRARSLFQDGVRDDDPHWCWWVDDGNLWWSEGAVRLDLGRNAEAVEFLELSAHSFSEPRMNFTRRAWALFGYCLNGSWSNVEKSLRGLIGDAGIFRSRRAEIRLKAALDIIEDGNVPNTVRDLASALRATLANAAQRATR